MRNVLLTIEYDGTRLSGWQRQPLRRTVQGELERCLARILGQEVLLAGVSRTDAGVHAHAQKASFFLNNSIPLQNLKTALNNMLSGGKANLLETSDIRIVEIEEKASDFHARFSAVGKKYIYLINNNIEESVFERNYSYHVKKPLDIEKMRVAAKQIVGTHDFVCFQAAGSNPRQTTVRTIYSLEIENKRDNQISIQIKGDGFLYNMVRIIVGTLVEVGYGKIPQDGILEIIHEKDRKNAGHTAPARGLYLAEVYYEKTEL
ncbi:MAG: tRNA pseudouridine(38-40) synthase TruA [Eubacteriales bacterium]